MQHSVVWVQVFPIKVEDADYVEPFLELLT